MGCASTRAGWSAGRYWEGSDGGPRLLGWEGRLREGFADRGRSGPAGYGSAFMLQECRIAGSGALDYEFAPAVVVSKTQLLDRNSDSYIMTRATDVRLHGI